jgi:hypothetical protein
VQRIAVLNRAVEARASAALRELQATVRARQHAEAELAALYREREIAREPRRPSAARRCR